MKFPDQLTNGHLMGKKAPTMVKIGRMLKPGITLSMILTSNTLDIGRLNSIPLQDTITSNNFYKAGLQAEYRFANGKILRETFFLDPYIFTGFSASRINTEFYPGVPLGIGLNIWPLTYFGLNIQGAYEYVFGFDNYIHYTFGVVVRFGDMIDKDRDRIPDRYDACPEIFGLKKQNGCPDYDYDGVVDSLDKCPTEYGWSPANGCPDYDRDGVPDKYDYCPCQPGSKQNNGCPDSTQIVLPSHNAPPTNEQSKVVFPGVVETQKPTPKNEIITNQPKPVVEEIDEPITEQVEQAIVVEESPTENRALTSQQSFEEKIDNHLSNIWFNENSARVLSSSHESLDAIVQIMQQNQDKQFIVVGYADKTGSTEFNLYLSEVRAKAVKTYLVGKGVGASKIETRSIGETDKDIFNRPRTTQTKNRKIEIYLK